MTQWKKEKPCMKPFIGCLNCSAREMRQDRKSDPITISMHTRMYNGFGGWTILRDNKCFYMGPTDKEFYEYPTLMKFENEARKDPDHDWRAECFLPLRDATYQRQGKNTWILIKSGRGFA